MRTQAEGEAVCAATGDAGARAPAASARSRGHRRTVAKGCLVQPLLHASASDQGQDFGDDRLQLLGLLLRRTGRVDDQVRGAQRLELADALGDDLTRAEGSETLHPVAEVHVVRPVQVVERPGPGVLAAGT